MCTQTKNGALNELIAELKAGIIAALRLGDVSPEDLKPDTSFWGGGLALDSVDILDLVIFLDREYSLRITSRELGEKVLIDFRTLAQYILDQRSMAKESAGG